MNGAWNVLYLKKYVTMWLKHWCQLVIDFFLIVAFNKNVELTTLNFHSFLEMFKDWKSYLTNTVWMNNKKARKNSLE
jgi:hypothetical protein